MAFKKHVACLLITALVGSWLGTASAQNLGGVLDLMGRVVEEDMRRQEMRREQEAQRQLYERQRAYEAEQRREQEEAYRRREAEEQRAEVVRQQAALDAQREEEIALIKRSQAALAELGFYRSKVDGDRGPGSRSAEAAYRAAFGLVNFEIIESEVRQLEQYAATGFRSRAELDRASKGRFATRADLLEAEAGGFTTSAAFLDARRLGIRNSETYEAFGRSGFRDVEAFLAARKGGFDDPSEFATAKRQGFAERNEYLAFRNSGLRDRASYLEANALRERREGATASCLTGVPDASAPSGVIDACLTAIQLGPIDDEFEKVFKDIGDQLASRRAQLESGNVDRSETKVAVADGGSPPLVREPEPADPSGSSLGAGAFLQEMALLDAALGAHSCGLAYIERRFEDASRQCVGEGQSARASILAALQANAGKKAADERARAEAEAEQQRREAAAEQQRLALEAAHGRARELLQSIGEFTAARRTLSAPLDVAKAVVAVRQNETGSDVTVLEQANGRLEALLDKEADFQTFLAERETAERVAVVNARTTAVAEVERLQAFIEQYVAKNILSDDVDALLTLQANLAAAGTSDDHERILRAQRDGRAKIEQHGLIAELELFTMPATDNEAKGEVEEAANGLAVTPLNSALLQGEPRDVLILGNYSPTAPHLIINLLGETVFEERRADFCWYGQSSSQTPAGRLALERLAELGIDEAVEQSRCAVDDLPEQDLVIVQRGEFLESDVLEARRVVAAFEQETLRLLATVAWTEVGRVAEDNTRTADQIEADILAGVREGFGFVAFQNAATSVCPAVTDTDLELHRAVIGDALPGLSRFIRADEVLGAMPLDRAFVRVQRRECSAIYANEADLKVLLDGVKRARIEYAVVPFWAEPGLITETTDRLASQNNAQQTAVAARKQEIEADAQLAAAKANDAREVRRREQAELRERYGQEANAAFNDLSELAERYFRNHPEDDGRLASLFPIVGHQKAQRDRDDWELDAYKSELVDYGTADWKGRRAEVVFANLSVRSKNRVLGEYADDCFTVGYLIDAEFGLLRDPVAVLCGTGNEAVAEWKNGRGYESRWLRE